ncbi:MAG: nucleotidyltransferase [Xanthomonadales bacterium]|nr:nucleotidyltransferase [Xanthomonadales bacterium]
MIERHDSLLQSAVAVDAALHSRGIEHALIGGLAVLLRARERATFDVDFLIDGSRHQEFLELLRESGFEVLTDNLNFGNFVGPGGLRVDALYAVRVHGKAMLARAAEIGAAGVRLRVVQAEDLIGLKLQALRNNPTRHRDWDDIRALYRMRDATFDDARVREFVAMFGFEDEYRRILDLES